MSFVQYLDQQILQTHIQFIFYIMVDQEKQAFDKFEDVDDAGEVGVLLKILQERRNLIVNELARELLGLDDCPETRQRVQQRLLKSSTFWEEDCQRMPEKQFVAFYRLSKETFGEVLRMIYPDLVTFSVTGTSIDPAKKLAITLRYLATGCDFSTLAHLFGVGDSTVRLIVRDVTDAIATHPSFKSLVECPSTEEDFFTISRGFFDMFQFPDCVGAVDDTHIQITKPSTDPSSYFDYKKHYSVHLQAECDSRTRVLFYYIGAPGKNNDG